MASIISKVRETAAAQAGGGEIQEVNESHFSCGCEFIRTTDDLRANEFAPTNIFLFS